MLLEHGADVNAVLPVETRGMSNATLLHFFAAADRDDDKLFRLPRLQFLLEHGADVNATSSDGSTPLHVAAGRGNTVTVVLLLDHGAGVNIETESGDTALKLAMREGHTTTADMLRAKGAVE